jgi:hypothetical protein
MSVWFAALLLARLSSRFQRGLKPWFGTTVLIAVVRLVAVTRFTLTALSVFAETIVRIATVIVAFLTTGLTLDVAFLATGLTVIVAFLTTGLTVDVALLTTGLTLDVALFTTGLTLDVAFLTTGLTLDVALFAAGFFATGFFTAAVLGAVGRRVSGLVADSAGLIQERWADDFSLRSGLILDEVAGVFLFGTSGIKAHFAVWLGSGDGGGGGISGRHCIRFDCFWLEALLVSDLRKNISIFFQMPLTSCIMLFSEILETILNAPPTLQTKMNERILPGLFRLSRSFFRAVP